MKSTTKYQINTNISLNETEASIFRIINEFLKAMSLKTIVRVVGGWVRDKVSAKSSFNSFLL